MQYNLGYDPDFFRATLRAITDLLAEDRRRSLEGAGKVLVQKPVSAIAEELDFERVIAQGGADLPALARTLLANSNHLHHPAYIGHQVAVPMTGAAVADLINGSTNNSMPVYEMGPAATAVELKVIEWALGKVGWRASGSGVMTHGGSMANLTCLLAARASALPEAWQKGLPANAVILVPESSHYSNTRAGAIMGLGTQNVIPVPVDAEYRVRVKDLKDLYQAQIKAGKTVIAIVANACGTATGNYDDLVAIGEFCQERKVWLHVDGAHGAAALLSPRFRHLLKGVELADSLTWDTHKMMATSSLCGMALFRQKSRMLQTFSQEASYIFNSFEKPGEDVSLNTLECTKSMLGLKLFFNLAIVGERGLAEHVETLYDLTRRFHERISHRPGFSCLCPPDSNILCFRYGEDSALQDRIRQKIVLEGDFYITRASVHQKSYLRLSVMNPYTSLAQVDALCDEIERLAR